MLGRQFVFACARYADVLLFGRVFVCALVCLCLRFCQCLCLCSCVCVVVSVGCEFECVYVGSFVFCLLCMFVVSFVAYVFVGGRALAMCLFA